MRRRLPLWLVNLVLRFVVRSRLSMVATPEALRLGLEMRARRSFRLPPGTQCHEDTLAGIPALWAAPEGAGEERVVLYLHGGAYLAGSSRTHRHLGAALGAPCNARAVLPDYRLAPEHPFPAALDDALACYRALLERGVCHRAIALAGDSAGGGLAAALLLAIQNEGLPRPAAAVLFSPWADMTMTAPTLQRNARREAMLPVRRMGELVSLVLAGHDPADPLASPARGAFRDPPPVLLFAGRTEILLDDALALADALRQGGGDVQLELHARAPHAWPVFVGRLKAADAAVALAGQFLARQFSRTD